MMKYGYNDYEWNKDLFEAQTKFVQDVIYFNTELFIPAMKRKTVTEKDEQALKALNEMVEMLNKHFAEVRKV